MVVWKGSGSQASLSNYRDVVLSDATAKVALANIRGNMLDTVANSVVGTQYGSDLNLGSTAITHTVVRAYRSIASV